MSKRQHLLDLDRIQLGELVSSLGHERFRVDQIQKWVYDKGAESFEQMTNLSKGLRTDLDGRFCLYTSRVVLRSVSSDASVKLLLKWPDGATSECVLIPEEHRQTACVSSQVGCPVGCRFCASGIGGLQRNLTAGQIVEQVLRINAEARGLDRRLSNVVFMGLGEPLANYDAVLRAVRTINAPWGPNIGARKITLSTVGLPAQIRRLAGEGLQINLALSLHAPTDGLRRELIPWAEQIGISELAQACRHYFELTGREITLEYVLLSGVNDRLTHAQQLARFTKQFRCNVNLIRYNTVESLPFESPTRESALGFQRSLREHGVNSHIRTSRGRDINAACGQLRRMEEEGAPDLGRGVRS